MPSGASSVIHSRFKVLHTGPSKDHPIQRTPIQTGHLFLFQGLHLVPEQQFDSLGICSEVRLEFLPPTLLIRTYSTFAAQGYIVTVINEQGVFTDQDIIVVRKVLTDTETLKTIGENVFRVWKLIQEGLMNEDGVTG